MADLDERFRSLARTGPPDLWPDIESREPRSGIPPTQGAHRALAAAVALVVAVAGIGLAALTFGGSETTSRTRTSGSAGVPVANGSIAFSSGVGGYHIAAVRPDGSIQDLTTPPDDQVDLGPAWSPDGTRFAALRYAGGDYELVVANADGRELIDFDQRAEDFAWAPSGSALVTTSFQRGSDLDLFVVDIDSGARTELVVGPLADADPSWSPNGDAIAFVTHPVRDRAPGSADIFVVRPDGTGLRQLTDDTAWEAEPVWSPDGSAIAYVSEGTDGTEIFVMNRDGSQQRQVTDAPSNDVASFAWSPDGTQIAFEVHTDSSWDIFVVDADGTGQVRIADGPEDEVGPEWSPDGVSLAYAAAESSESCQCDNSGSFDIYIMNPDGSGKTRLTEGAAELGGGLSWQPLIDREQSPFIEPSPPA